MSVSVAGTKGMTQDGIIVTLAQAYFSGELVGCPDRVQMLGLRAFQALPLNRQRDIANEVSIKMFGTSLKKEA